MLELMDPTIIFNAILSFSLLIMGWLMRVGWDVIKRLRDDIEKVEKELDSHYKYAHENYVRREDFFYNMNEIKGMIQQILSKLDNKADK